MLLVKSGKAKERRRTGSASHRRLRTAMLAIGATKPPRRRLRSRFGSRVPNPGSALLAYACTSSCRDSSSSCCGFWSRGSASPKTEGWPTGPARGAGGGGVPGFGNSPAGVPGLPASSEASGADALASGRADPSGTPRGDASGGGAACGSAGGEGESSPGSEVGARPRELGCASSTRTASSPPGLLPGGLEPAAGIGSRSISASEKMGPARVPHSSSAADSPGEGLGLPPPAASAILPRRGAVKRRLQ